MGIRQALRGRRVYFDTMLFIYLMEGFAEFATQIEEIRDSLFEAESEIITSELTLCETLVRPFRRNDAELAATYRQFIEHSGAFSLKAATRDTWVRASLYRAQFGLKTPDAIHVATAVEAGCEMFVSNDRNIAVPAVIQVVDFSSA